ncbi:unnamed protein product [Tuber aestivum]|uniref:Uncharacterized protein n=1 Tax=Tuber aestivum TaxID=59557 RepID=A0A292PJY7_9PEZI|nr:unnamed protein product [Tuber aestivum]
MRSLPSGGMGRDLFHYERAMALKFIIHVISDIHQPLHTEHLLGGSKGKGVPSDRVENTPHRAWNSAILEKHMGETAIQNATRQLNNLYIEIETGDFDDPFIKQWFEVSEPGGGYSGGAVEIVGGLVSKAQWKLIG